MCHRPLKSSTIPYHAIPWHAVPYHITSCRTIPYHAIPYHTITSHTVPCHAIVIPYHAMPCHTIHAMPHADGRRAAWPESELLCHAHDNDVRMLVTVLAGSDTTGKYFQHLLGNATAVQRMARELLAIVAAAGWDGVEFDFEGTPPLAHDALKCDRSRLNPHGMCFGVVSVLDVSFRKQYCNLLLHKNYWKLYTYIASRVETDEAVPIHTGSYVYIASRVETDAAVPVVGSQACGRRSPLATRLTSQATTSQ